MKTRETHNSLFQQRFTLLMALLFCVFVSGLEYLPQEGETGHTEQTAENPSQTFLNVAVDAVVPFVLHIADTVFYLIHQIFVFEFKLPIHRAVSVFSPNQLVEILFGRIISPQGP